MKTKKPQSVPLIPHHACCLVLAARASHKRQEAVLFNRNCPIPPVSVHFSAQNTTFRTLFREKKQKLSHSVPTPIVRLLDYLSSRFLVFLFSRPLVFPFFGLFFSSFLLSFFCPVGRKKSEKSKKSAFFPIFS